MEISRDCDIDQHDVEIRSVIGTDHIRLPFFKLEPTLDSIEDAQGPYDKVCPDFLQPENIFEPFFPPEKDKKNREKGEESQHRIDEKKRTPDPLQSGKRIS
jgi:hypothetical protein